MENLDSILIPYCPHCQHGMDLERNSSTPDSTITKCETCGKDVKYGELLYSAGLIANFLEDIKI